VLTMHEIQTFNPSVIPENVARGFVSENKPFKAAEEAGGKDMFGVEWVYEASVGGSMEKPGEPFMLEDVNDWKEKLVFPDVDSWDWAGSVELNKGFLKPDMAVQSWLFTGWFERLISFMGFEEAAVALLDEDQEDAIKELMFALSDVYCKIVEHLVKDYGVTMFYVHDDWGDLCEDDKELNRQAKINGGRILAAYTTDNGKVYIITDDAKAVVKVTTVLYASEY